MPVKPVGSLYRIAVGGLQVLGALSFIAVGIHLAQTGIDIKWIVIGGSTLFWFGYVCYRTKDLWSNSRYWAIFGGVLALHIILVVVVQRIYPNLPGIYYVSFGTLEACLLAALLILLSDR